MADPNDLRTTLNLNLNSSEAEAELNKLISTSQEAVKGYSDVFYNIGKNIDYLTKASEKLGAALKDAFSHLPKAEDLGKRVEGVVESASSTFAKQTQEAINKLNQAQSTTDTAFVPQDLEASYKELVKVGQATADFVFKSKGLATLTVDMENYNKVMLELGQAMLAVDQAQDAFNKDQLNIDKLVALQDFKDVLYDLIKANYSTITEGFDQATNTVGKLHKAEKELAADAKVADREKKQQLAIQIKTDKEIQALNNKQHEQFLKQQELQVSSIKTRVKATKSYLDAALRERDLVRSAAQAGNIGIEAGNVAQVLNNLQTVVRQAKAGQLVISDELLVRYNKLIENLNRYSISLKNIIELEKTRSTKVIDDRKKESDALEKARRSIINITKDMSTMGSTGSTATKNMFDQLKILNPALEKADQVLVQLAGSAYSYASGMQNIGNRLASVITLSEENAAAAKSLGGQFTYFFNSVNAAIKKLASGDLNTKTVEALLIQINHLERELDLYTATASTSGQMTDELANSLSELKTMSSSTKEEVTRLYEAIASTDAMSNLIDQANSLNRIFDIEKRIQEIRGATSFAGSTVTAEGKIEGEAPKGIAAYAAIPNNVIQAYQEFQDLTKGGASAIYILDRALRGSSETMTGWRNIVNEGNTVYEQLMKKVEQFKYAWNAAATVIGFFGKKLGFVTVNAVKEVDRLNNAFKYQTNVLRIQADLFAEMTKEQSKYTGYSDDYRKTLSEVTKEINKLASGTDTLNRSAILGKNVDSELVAVTESRTIAVQKLNNLLATSKNLTQEDRDSINALLKQLKEFDNELELTTIREQARTKAMKENGVVINAYGKAVKEGEEYTRKFSLSIEGLISVLIQLAKLPLNIINNIVKGIRDLAKALVSIPANAIKTVASGIGSIGKAIVSFPLNAIKKVVNSVVDLANGLKKATQQISATLLGGPLGGLFSGPFFEIASANIFNQVANAAISAAQAILEYNAIFAEFAAMERVYYTAKYNGMTREQMDEQSEIGFRKIEDAASKANTSITDMVQAYLQLQRLGLDMDKWLIPLSGVSRAFGIPMTQMVDSLAKLEAGMNGWERGIKRIVPLIKLAGYDLETFTTEQLFNFITTNEYLTGVVNEMENTYTSALADITRYLRSYILPIRTAVFDQALAPILFEIRDFLAKFVPSIRAVATNVGEFF